MGNKSLNQLSRLQGIGLRLIILCYLSLFASAIVSSVYLLSKAMDVPPVSAVVFFKYILLAVVFSILCFRACKALPLGIVQVRIFRSATANFKWLFGIALVLVILAQLGLFDQAAGKPVIVSREQCYILALLSIFAFVSDWFLQRVLPEEELESS